MNEIIIGAGSDHAALGADDPRGDRVVQAERIADGKNPLTDVEVFGVAQLQDGQVDVGVDLDQRDIGARVGSDELGDVFFAVLERDPDFLRVFDYVIVGDDIAFLIQDEPGAKALALKLPGVSLAEKTLEKLLKGHLPALLAGTMEEMKTISFFHRLGGGYVNDRRARFFGKLREALRYHGRTARRSTGRPGG